MEPISQKELEEIFDGTEFKLRVDTYPWIKNFRYCCIDRGDESLCCLRGEIAENQIFNEIYYASVNHKTGVGKDDTRDECRMLFMKLPPDKRKRLFSVLGFSEATKWEEKSFEEKQERESELDALLERKPQYGHFFENNNVYAVGMREELILDNIKAPQFIGTFGMGPCIGVGIISRGGGEIRRVGLTHIDALTDLNSLTPFIYSATKDAENVDIVMVSSDNDRERGRKILERILLNSDLRKKAKVFSELDGSSSFAINTLTGSIYKDIPMTSFIESRAMTEMEAMLLHFPGRIKRSAFYDSQKRKSATKVIKTAPKSAGKDDGDR